MTEYPAPMKALLACYLLWGVSTASGTAADDFHARERANLRLERAGSLGLLVAVAGSLLSTDPEARCRMSRVCGGKAGEMADWIRGLLLLCQAPHSHYGMANWMQQDNATGQVYLKALWLASLLGCEPGYQWGGMRSGEPNSAYWLNSRLDDARMALWGYRPQDR